MDYIYYMMFFLYWIVYRILVLRLLDNKETVRLSWGVISSITVDTLLHNARAIEIQDIRNTYMNYRTSSFPLHNIGFMIQKGCLLSDGLILSISYFSRLINLWDQSCWDNEFHYRNSMTCLTCYVHHYFRRGLCMYIIFVYVYPYGEVSYFILDNKRWLAGLA